jgi:creatinine amidohydrolase
MTPGILSDMTIDEVRAFDPQLVVFGVGSTEPHGPALPYGTDYFCCDYIARRATLRANELGGRVLMYPTLPVGNNVNFKAWPFACRISVRTLMLTLEDIIEALEEDGIRKIVLLNGHGGNTAAMHAVCREHFDRTPADRRAFVCVTSSMPDREALAAITHPSDHGGEGETSRQMYVRPEAVRAEKLDNFPRGVPTIKMLDGPRVHWVRPWHLHYPVSAGGDARASSPEKGKPIIESGIENLAKFLAELSQAPWHPDFPYPPRASTQAAK